VHRTLRLCYFGIALPILLGCQPAEKVSLKDECLKTLSTLAAALRNLQITDPRNPDFGALQCPTCNVLHTRAAEAVYPFAVMYKQTNQRDYAESAIRLGNWLIRQQLADGSWQETPEQWTGTTTDQLLMMVLAYEILKHDLSPSEQQSWQTAMTKAADYLLAVMSPQFASINYCATTTATLAMMNRFFPNERWAQKAGQLALQVAATMDEDGFICAEGDLVHDHKYGADIGYDMDMSLWGLALYARLAKDAKIESLVTNSLENHLYFVYPNGAIDGSWGIRSNKWTTFGSSTADGCQILFSLFAGNDARYRTAAMRNLTYLRSMTKDGLVGYGPHYWELFARPLCFYPTFVRAKNLAMTVEFGDQKTGAIPPLPADETGWFRFFPTVDVALVRSKNIMATIPAYRYKSMDKRAKSKYMHRPSGGSASLVWVEKYGFLQISSQTEYHRWEPMHFPEVSGIACLTPRIEFQNEFGYFTNLYEFDGRMTVSKAEHATAVVQTSGELSDRTLHSGGVAYTLTHRISDYAIEKSVVLRYRDKDEEVSIVEPVVKRSGFSIKLLDARTVLIEGERRSLRLELLSGEASIELGKDEEKYWAVFPSVRCYPIVLHVKKPAEEYQQKTVYQFRIVR